MNSFHSSKKNEFLCKIKHNSNVQFTATKISNHDNIFKKKKSHDILLQKEIQQTLKKINNNINYINIIFVRVKLI